MGDTTTSSSSSGDTGSSKGAPRRTRPAGPDADGDSEPCECDLSPTGDDLNGVHILKGYP